MKLKLLVPVLSLTLAACGMEDTMQNMASKNPDSKARAIAADYGCLSCHTKDNSVVGPAWRLVAERYQNVPDAKSHLVNSISSGSFGRWQNKEKMPAFKDRMSNEEINLIVNYILKLAQPAEIQNPQSGHGLGSE